MSDKDIQELRSYSDRNMQRLRDAAGPLAVVILPALMQRHQKIFNLNLYHESLAENIPEILKSGHVFSKDEIDRRGAKVAAGMTVDADSKCDMFNCVTHKADSYTDFVYARPIFGPASKGGATGVLWNNYPVREDMWFSFTDPNQITFADKELIEWGMTVVKSFDSYDAYVGNDIPKAIALRALSQMAQIDYIGRIRKFGYDQQMRAHEQDPRYSTPDEKDNMTLHKALDYYSDIMLEQDSVFKYYDHAIWGRDREENIAALDKAGLTLTYGKPPALSQEVIDHPSFDEFFTRNCAAIMKQAAMYGQIAVPHAISIEGAEVYLKSAPQKNIAPKAAKNP